MSHAGRQTKPEAGQRDTGGAPPTRPAPHTSAFDANSHAQFGHSLSQIDTSQQPEEAASLGVLDDGLTQSEDTLAPVALPAGRRVQTKLTVNPAGDSFEREADAVAARVVAQMHSPPTALGGPAPGARHGGGGLGDSPVTVAQRAGSGAGMAAPSHVESGVAAARGGGQPLSASLRGPLEQSLGTDFGGVRVHIDAHSDTLSRSIQAKAFTTGQDVFFSQGAYDPGSRSGQELIAHELTHVVQQTGGAGAAMPGAVQRAIGFEFEFGQWQTRHDDPKKTPLAKGEEIINGGKYKIEGEDAGKTSAIEVVTHPYTTEGEATASVGAAQTLMQQIAANGAEHPASDHGGKGGVLITPHGAKGKMQASPAVSLDKIPDLYKKGVGTSYTGFVNSVTTSLQSDKYKDYFGEAGPSAELQGLVLLIVDYLAQGANSFALNYPKSAFKIMARTSFTKMFSLVPEHTFFQKPENIDKWVNMILETAMKNPDIGKAKTPGTNESKKWWAKPLSRDQAASVGGLKPATPAVTRDKTLAEVRQDPVMGMNLMEIEALKKKDKGATYKLTTTREEWLQQMPTEDLLSKATDKRFEGMGAYGNATDVRVPPQEEPQEDAPQEDGEAQELEQIAEMAAVRVSGEIEPPKEGGEIEPIQPPQVEGPPVKQGPAEAPLFELRGLQTMFEIEQDVTLANWIEKVKEVFKLVDGANGDSFQPGGKPTVVPDVDNPAIWEKQKKK